MLAPPHPPRPVHIISTCSAKDSRTWTSPSACIESRISSDTYVVIVPDPEVPLFKKISARSYTVIGEVDFLEGVSVDYVRARMPDNNKSRASWYYQQLIKLSALQRLPATDEDVLVIWDGDTIPLRNINFINADGKLNYFRGSEYHLPYFVTIQRLLGMTKLVDFSFIAQCFPIYRRWIKELINTMQLRTGKMWTDAILDCTDLGELSGFSEYETMGTFLTHTHLSQMAIRNCPWERFGKQKYDIDELRNLNTVETQACYVSFESWEKDVLPR
jgi:hypothetical protein